MALVQYKLLDEIFQLMRGQAPGRPPHESFFLGFAHVIPGPNAPAIHTFFASKDTIVYNVAGHTSDIRVRDLDLLALTAHSFLSCPNSTRVHDLNSPAKAAQSFEPGGP